MVVVPMLDVMSDILNGKPPLYENMDKLNQAVSKWLDDEHDRRYDAFINKREKAHLESLDNERDDF